MRLDTPRGTHYPPLTLRTINEQCSTSVLNDGGENHMVRAVAEEALALASISLFVAMLAVWAQVLGVA
jgi:hypothetical protein